MKRTFFTLTLLISSNLFCQQLFLGSLNDSSAIIRHDGKIYKITLRGYDEKINEYVDVRSFTSTSIPKDFHSIDDKDENGNYYLVPTPAISGNFKNEYSKPDQTIYFNNDWDKYRYNMRIAGYTIISETESTGGYRLVTWKKGEEYISIIFINDRFDSQTTTKY